MFGLKPKLKQALLIRQPHTYDDAVTFAKRKHHFADTDSGTQLMDLLQEIRKEVSLKHTGIKQEPFQYLPRIPMPSIFNKKSPNLKRICEILKESMNTSHHQHAAPLHTNPVTLQQQLSKMKEDTRHLLPTKHPNAYPTPPGNYRSFWTMDGLVICQQCDRVGHFARA